MACSPARIAFLVQAASSEIRWWHSQESRKRQEPCWTDFTGTHCSVLIQIGSFVNCGLRQRTSWPPAAATRAMLSRSAESHMHMLHLSPLLLASHMCHRPAAEAHNWAASWPCSSCSLYSTAFSSWHESMHSCHLLSNCLSKESQHICAFAESSAFASTCKSDSSWICLFAGW